MACAGWWRPVTRSSCPTRRSGLLRRRHCGAPGRLATLPTDHAVTAGEGSTVTRAPSSNTAASRPSGDAHNHRTVLGYRVSTAPSVSRRPGSSAWVTPPIRSTKGPPMATSVRPNPSVVRSSIRTNDNARSSSTNSLPPSGSSLIRHPSPTPPYSRPPSAIARLRLPVDRLPGRRGPGRSLVLGPQEAGQLAGERRQLVGDRAVAGHRSAVGIHHVVGVRVVGQRRTGPVTVGIVDPRAEPLVRSTRADGLSSPNQLLELEGLRPAGRSEEHRLLHMSAARSEEHTPQ